MKRYFRFLPILVLVLFSATTVFARIESTIGGKGTAKNYRWKVDSGDIVPADDSTYDIGESGAEVQAIYADAFVLGGVSKASWGSVVSPWEDDGTTSTLTSAPTKFILTHATGVSSFTGYIAGTADVVLENGQIIDGGTNNSVILTENSDSLSLTYSGDDVVIDTTDGGVIFTLTDSDGTLDIMTQNDADDYIQFSTTTNQPLINFVGCNGKITAGSGTIDFDNENLTTTGTLSAGAITSTSLVIGDDVIDVVVDDILRFASNDEKSTIEAYGFEAKDAVLRLDADEGDDAGDTWEIESDQTSNDMLFTNDTTVKDTQATILTLADSGIITTTNDIYVVNDSATTDAVQDVLKLTSSSTGTGAAGLGAGIVFHIDDVGGIEEQASIDVALTDATDGSEDVDITFSQNVAGTITAALTLNADGANTMANDLLISGSDLTLNAAGVKLTGDADGAITFLGLGDGSDEDMTINLDDVANEITISSSTGVTLVDLDGALDLEVSGADITLAEAGVKLTGSDGDLTILGLGDGNDEDLTINFDDGTANHVDISSSTGVSVVDFGTIDLASDALDLSEGDITNAGDIACDTITSDASTVVTINDGIVGLLEAVTTSSADPGVGVGSLTTVITAVTTDDTGTLADEVSLADGTTGQIKIFTLKADTETTGLKIVPAHLAGGTYILLEDVGDGCVLVYDGTSWIVVGNNGGTIG